MFNQKLVLLTLVCCVLLAAVCQGEEKDDCDKCGPTRVSLSVDSYERFFPFNLDINPGSDDWLQGRPMLLQMHQEMPRKGQ